MLRIVIIFCIISSHESTSRITENYAKLVLVQRLSITNFFYEEIHRPDVNTKSAEFRQYLKNHKEIFEAKSWVLHGLWPLDSENRLLKSCVTSSLEELSLNYENLDDNLKNDLKREWPILTVKGTHKSQMEMEYNEYGSCVNGNATLYFQKSLELFRKYNLQTVLNEDNFPLGGTYFPYFIKEVVKDTFGTRSIVDCLSPKYIDPEDKLLLQIQLCFDVNSTLVGCKHGKKLSAEYSCASTSNRLAGLIEYPAIPRNAYHLLDNL